MALPAQLDKYQCLPRFPFHFQVCGGGRVFALTMSLSCVCYVLVRSDAAKPVQCSDTLLTVYPSVSFGSGATSSSSFYASSYVMGIVVWTPTFNHLNSCIPPTGPSITRPVRITTRPVHTTRRARITTRPVQVRTILQARTIQQVYLSSLYFILFIV